MRSRSGVRAVNADSNERSRIWSIGVLFLLLSVAVLLASCGEEEAPGGEENAAGDTEVGVAEETAGGEAAVSLDNIVDDPSEFYGQTVTVDGTVARVVDPEASVIVPPAAFEQEQQEGDNELFEDDEALAEQGALIYSPVGDMNLSEGQSIQVTGEVREFDETSFQEDFDDAFDNEIFTAFQERPAIIADQVQQMEGGATNGQ